MFIYISSSSSDGGGDDDGEYMYTCLYACINIKYRHWHAQNVECKQIFMSNTKYVADSVKREIHGLWKKNYTPKRIKTDSNTYGWTRGEMGNRGTENEHPIRRINTQEKQMWDMRNKNSQTEYRDGLRVDVRKTFHSKFRNLARFLSSVDHALKYWTYFFYGVQIETHQ